MGRRDGGAELGGRQRRRQRYTFGCLTAKTENCKHELDVVGVGDRIVNAMRFRRTERDPIEPQRVPPARGSDGEEREAREAREAEENARNQAASGSGGKKPPPAPP